MAKNYVPANGQNCRNIYANDVKIKNIYANDVLVYRSEQPVADLTSENGALSGACWNLSEFTAVSFKCVFNAGYGRWMGDGSAIGGSYYAFLQLNDGTQIQIPGTAFDLGGGVSGRGTKTVAPTIDLSLYSAAQRSKVYLGTSRYTQWALATGMYDFADAAVTNAVAT